MSSNNVAKILVVEDNDFVRMQIVRFLQEDGYDVVEATDGDAALDAVGVDGGGFAAAVVDIRMEPVGGLLCQGSAGARYSVSCGLCNR